MSFKLRQILEEARARHDDRDEFSQVGGVRNGKRRDEDDELALPSLGGRR